MAINTSNNKVRIISTTVSGLSTNSKFSDIKSPALVVNTSDGGIFYADGAGGTSLKQLAALPSHTHSGYATTAQLDNYLPKVGGTLTGSLTLPGNKYQATAATEYAIDMSNSDIVNLNAIYTCDTANSANEGFQFKRDNGNYDSIWAANGVFYFSPDGSPVGSGSYSNNYTVIHSGNYTSYCSSLGHSHSYLPLSGGTVRGDFAINNETDTTLRYFRIWYYASNRKNRGLFRVNENNTAVSYYSPTDGINHELTIGRDGFKYNNNDIIHSGNIGSQSVASATKLGSYTIDSFMTFGNHTNYVGARFQNSNLAQLAVDTYIEFWSSPGWFNSAWGKVTAHGGFTGNLTGNVTGNVSGSSGSCTGNAATATSATTATQLSGFTKRANGSATWGTLTSANGYTPVYWVDTASSGGIGISDKNQQTYVQIDGYFYQNEGQYQVLDTNTGAAKSHTHAIGDLPTHTFSSVRDLGWSSTIGTSKIPTINTIAYWNGAHSGTSSNLQYCDRGRFGTIVTKNAGDYISSKSVVFTPAETAIGPADVLSKLGSGYALGKGTWDYAGNGYISKDTTGSIAIDLAGCSVIQLGSSSAYTQLYITAPATSGTANAKSNEILFYNNHGSDYAPAWTRVLTNRNYSEYCLPTTGATHSGAFTISSGGDLILKASSSATNDPGDLAFYNNSGSELARIYYGSSKMLMRYGSSAASYEILTTNTGAAKSHTHSYLPLAGGTMTGNISFQGTKQSYTMIRFVDNTTDVNGNGISIGGGGATIIGGGESASAAQGLLSSGGDERMIICNDADIEFFSNCQSGIASRKTMTFNSSGQLIAGNFITNSDRRLKTNINEISSDKLSNSLNLNFVEFDYKDNDKHSAGHIAQEVKDVLPEFVHGEETETEHLSIDYTGLHSVQIKALIDENNIMKKEIKELKELIKTLINEK